ncbi:cyclic peptide export ABC transporter [Microbulbifer sp. ANSA003]|uniref:cyclic peptide export ABC transporter n=1 Tax=Microbulbifer sp. ANSA003 TaxID=3243360 RepID=UPI0040419D9D
MKLLDYIPRHTFVVTLLFVVFISLFPAIISVKLLAEIGGAISRVGTSEPVMPMGAAYYIGLVLMMIILAVISRFFMSRFKEEMLLKIREQTASKVFGSTLQNIEKIGAAQLYNLLTEDVGHVSSLLATLPYLIFNSLLIIIGFFYIAHMSWGMFFMVLFLTCAAAAIAGIMQSGIQKKTFEERGLKDNLYQLYESIIYGKKELSLSHSRTRYISKSKLAPLLQQMQEKVIDQDLRWSGVITFTDSMILLIILSLLFLVEQVTAEVLSITVLIIFYLKGPVSTIMSSMPTILHARVSLARLSVLSQFSDRPFSARPNSLYVVDELNYQNIHFSYLDEAQRPAFQLGPLNIVFRKGEVTMLNGGNGSGKSTLCKIISGLYPHHDGAIYVNGEISSEPEKLRSLFSCQMFDYYLFDDLPGGQEALSDEQLAFVYAYLKELKLEHIVDLKGNTWSTTNLSSGQKRRLALVATLFESKPIILFDEWAADQDPYFRHFFYNVLLPRLASQNKIVIVVSHDEHYFSHADKIYTLREGQLVAEETGRAAELIAANE